MSDVEKYQSGCKIIYGYNPGCLDDILDSQGQLVILIEPRTDRIDQIQSLKIKDFILIKKVLVKTNVLSETIFHYDKDRDIYFMKDDGLVVNGSNLFNVKKYKAYTTSMENIIKEYAIQNIHSLTININIKNCNEIIQSIEAYNHILSRIHINKQIGNYQCKILDDFYSKVLDQYITFTHKNLHIELPKILVYFYESQNKRLKEMTLLMQQYKMALVINKLQDDLHQSGASALQDDLHRSGASALQDDQQDTSTITNDTGDVGRQDNVSVIVPYPESIKYIDIGILKPSKIYYENVINNLACIFNSDKSNSLELDIIIQFNPKYFDSKNTLQIMYPLDDNVFYINKVFDVIYGTKNCMFMLYQILKSKYFTDYIEEKIAEKKSLFKIFSKRYFYDYISKIFIIKEI